MRILAYCARAPRQTRQERRLTSSPAFDPATELARKQRHDRVSDHTKCTCSAHLHTTSMLRAVWTETRVVSTAPATLPASFGQYPVTWLVNGAASPPSLGNLKQTSPLQTRSFEKGSGQDLSGILVGVTGGDGNGRHHTKSWGFWGIWGWGLDGRVSGGPRAGQ